MATFEEILKGAFAGKIFKCDCGHFGPVLIRGSISYGGLQVYDLRGEGKLKDCLIDDFQCHRGNMVEIAPRDLTSDEAQNLANYEERTRWDRIPS